MALLFYDGFDSSATLATAISRYGATAGSQSLITGRTNNGIRIDNSGSLTTPAFTAGDTTCIVGVAFRVPAIFTNRNVIQIQEGSTLHIAVTLDTSGHLLVLRNATTLATSSTTLTLNTWYYVEIKATIHDSTGSYEVHVDESVFGGLSASGVDTRNGGTGQWDRVSIIGATGTTDHDFDDFYVCDGSGSANNDFLGDSKVQTLLPQTDATAAGSNADFTPSTGSDHGALVDEASPNGDTDYNSSSNAGDIDTYNYPSMSLTGTIRGVQVVPYAEKTDAGARTVSVVARVGGTDYVHSTAFALTTSYKHYAGPAQIFEENPNSSSAWLAADVNGAEFGLEVTT